MCQCKLVMAKSSLPSAVMLQCKQQYTRSLSFRLCISVIPDTWCLPDCMRRSLARKSLCSHIHRPPWTDAGREAAFSPPCLCASPPLPGGEPAAAWRSTAEGNLRPPAQHRWRGCQCLHLGFDPPWVGVLLSGQWPHWWSTGSNTTDKVRRLLCRKAMQTNVEVWSALTLCLNALSLSSLSLSLSLALRLCRCSSACSATVYLCRVQCLRIMPRVAPPWLGTLVKPWQRGKLNTVTWWKRTLLCAPASLGLFRMDRTGCVRKRDNENIRKSELKWALFLWPSTSAQLNHNRWNLTIASTILFYFILQWWPTVIFYHCPIHNNQKNYNSSWSFLLCSSKCCKTAMSHFHRAVVLLLAESP